MDRSVDFAPPQLAASLMSLAISAEIRAHRVGDRCCTIIKPPDQRIEDHAKIRCRQHPIHSSTRYISPNFSSGSTGREVLFLGDDEVIAMYEIGELRRSRAVTKEVVRTNFWNTAQESRQEVRSACGARLRSSGLIWDGDNINLDDATKFSNVLHKSGSDLVAHEPCGFIRTEAHVAADLQSAHSLLTGEHQVDDLEPVAEIDFGVLENGPRYVREAIRCVRGALVALPVEGVGFQLAGVRSPTAWAMHALRPSFSDQIGTAGFLIRERLIELCRRQLVDVFCSRHGPVPHYGRNIAWPI